jgi:hypothetical protein
MRSGYQEAADNRKAVRPDRNGKIHYCAHSADFPIL